MKKLQLIYLVFITVFALLNVSSSAQTKDDCLDCHDDPEFTSEIDGREISLDVNGDKFNYSAHKKINCVACHKRYDPEELPHNENASEINCLSCHPAAANCVDCHTSHNVLNNLNPNSNIYKSKLFYFIIGD